jgi:hypothetical protein
MTAFVQRVEVVATDARTGDRGQGWGGHQPVHTVHNDGTERLIYVRGDLEGSGRNWRLMKRAAGSSSWVQEGVGQTDSDVFLIRDPATDSAHIVAFPGGVPTILSGPTFAPVAIRKGEWPLQVSVYDGAGIGGDGTLVIETQYDHLTGGQATLDTDTVYASGRWNGNAWIFNPVVTRNIGERYCYDYILPGAFGDSSKIVGMSSRDVTKTVAGLPNVSGTYVWDGVRAYVSGVTSAASWSTFDIMPKHSQPDPNATVRTYMYEEDAFADGQQRLLTTHFVWDPGQSNKIYLTARDSTSLLYQGVISYGSVHPRVFQDSKGRLWLLSLTEGANPEVNLYRINADFTLGTPTNLSSAFVGLTIEGGTHPRIAVPRGGNLTTNFILGSFSDGAGGVVAFKIRLPD